MNGDWGGRWLIGVRVGCGDEDVGERGGARRARRARGTRNGTGPFPTGGLGGRWLIGAGVGCGDEDAGNAGGAGARGNP